MPRSRYSAKDERMVEHIRVSARKQGHSAERAEQIAWATTNKFKNKKTKKAGGTEYALPLASVAAAVSGTSTVPSPPKSNTPSQPAAKPPAPAPPAKTGTASPRMPAPPRPVTMKGKDAAKVKKDLPAGEAYAAMGKAGEAYLPRPKTPWATPRENMSRMSYGVRSKKDTIQRRREGIKPMGTVTLTAKSVQIMSLDEAFEDMRRSVGAPTSKALSTGYGKTSGGGALKAPNRGGARARNAALQRPVDLSVGDLERAMTAMPPPNPAGHQKKQVYLPGVHPTDSPLRAPKKLGPKKSSKHRRGDAGSITKMVPTLSASAAKVNEEGGATELANSFTEAPTLKKPRVVHKSEGESTMGKMDFNDLFKSELGSAAGDEVLIECPHCDHPITKSEALEKARGHKGKGKVTHQTGPKTSSAPHVRDQNPSGGTMRGGEGKGVLSPDRGVPGAKKTDAVVGVQNGKGSTRKSEKDDDSSSDDASKSGKPSMTMSYSKDAQEQREGGEQVKKGIIIRGTEQVQYIEDNVSPTGDAAIAKAIAEGRLGGTPPTQPLDLNNDLTRLLY